MALKRLSVSQVDTFDSTTPFGCERKWYLQHVMKLEVPQDPSAALGEAVHKSIEDYLKGNRDQGGANGLHPIALPGRHLIDELAPRVEAVEYKFEGAELVIAGVPFTGRIDIIESAAPGEPLYGVTDWKTTSDIKRYAKTPEGLKKSTQMVGYAEWFYRNRAYDTAAPLRLAHVYFQTRSRKAEKVTACITRDEVLAGVKRIEGLVERIKAASEKPSFEDLTPDWEKCNVARGCPFRAMCAKGANMGLFDMFGEEETTQVAEAPKAPEPKKHKLEIEDVVEEPAEAPKPTPEQVAKTRAYMGAENHARAVAEAQAEAEAPKRGPGRPPGIPNKPKVEAPAALVAKVEAPKPQPVRLTRVTVRHGVTLNMGNYQSVRVEVELEATGDITEAVRADIGAKAKRALEDECKAYLPKAKKETPPRAADE